MLYQQKEANHIGGVISIREDQVYTTVIECKSKQHKTAVSYV